MLVSQGLAKEMIVVSLINCSSSHVFHLVFSAFWLDHIKREEFKDCSSALKQTVIKVTCQCNFTSILEANLRTVSMLKKQDIHISYFQIREGFKKADLLEADNQKTVGLKQI